MANVQGSRENLIYIDDSDQSIWLSQPTRGGITGYVDLDGDEPMEKSIDEIPSQSRVRPRRRLHRPRAMPRSSTATPSISTIIDLTVSDDENPDLSRHDAPQREQAREGSSEAKATIPSRYGLQPVVSNTEPLAGTMPQPEPSAVQGTQSVAIQPTSSFAQARPLATGSANNVEDLEEMSDASPSIQRSRLAYETQHRDRLTALGTVPDPSNLADGKSGSGSCIIARVDIINRNSPDSPIGGRADEREQTTSWRAETNATLTSRRVDTTNKTGKRSPRPGRPEETHRSAKPRVQQLPFKPRAVKSAGSPPRRKPGSERPSHRLARNHAHPSSSSPVSSKDLLGERLSRERRVGKRPSTDSNTDPSDHRRKLGSANVTDVVPLKEPLNLTNARSSDMGAQFSGPIAPILETSECPLAEDPERMANVESPAKELDPSPSKLLQTEAGSSAQVSPIVAEDEDQRGKLPSPMRKNARAPTQMHILTSLAYSDVPTATVQLDAIGDPAVVRQVIGASLKHHLNERYEDHAYVVKNTMWRQRTCYERESRAQGNQKRLQPSPTTLSKKNFAQSTSPFLKMTDIQTPFTKCDSKASLHDITQEVFIKVNPKDIVVRSVCNVQTDTYEPEKLQIPSFLEYVSLRTNILADNESKLLTTPWLGDEERDEGQESTLARDLPRNYEIKHDINAHLDLREEQCRFYSATIESFFADIGVSWDTALYWLFASEALIRQINFSAERHIDYEPALLDRSDYDREAFHRADKDEIAILFTRGPDKSQAFLQQLQKPSVLQLRVTALACAAIMTTCKFSPWYMAKQSKVMQEYVHAKIRLAEAASNFSFRSIVCRVCHEHNCLFHGQIRERPESDLALASSEESSEDDIEEMEGAEAHKSSRKTSDVQEDGAHTDEDDLRPVHLDSDEDSDVEKVINYKFPANPDVDIRDKWSESNKPRRALPPPGPFKPRWWETNTNTVKWENRKPFVPCNHAGSCVDAECRCFRETITCEKSCRCSATCNRRFPGCKCAILPGKRACTTATGCICKKFNRECDADLCGACGATELLDPINRYNEELLQDHCCNVGLQRDVPKKTLLGKSEVHGFGLYAGENIREDDIIGEYTGEIISVGESNRREVVYSYEKNMYLFRVNKEQDVDATHMGNKLRFINNANKNLSNCESRVLFCNTVFRVALYASTDIKAGTEFFFHYNYPAWMTKNFKQPKGKVVAVKQVVKQPSKVKSKRALSRTSANNDPSPSSAGSCVEKEKPDRPWVRESLIKARAAKAAKREAILAEKDMHTSANTTPATVVRQGQARKSAGGPSMSRPMKDPNPRGRSRRVQDSGSREGSNASGSGTVRTRSTPTLIVQDTDDEDDENTAQDTQAGAQESKAEEDDPDTDAEDPVRSAQPRRARMAKSAPVVAVKKVKKKMGGARPGAGRKRKRPLIVNSEDE